MFIHQIKLRNILSFGPETQDLDLQPLNVLIGPNGSGKSNLLDVFGLLRAAPRNLTAPVAKGGGVANWIWRGEPAASSAEVETLVDNTQGNRLLRHRLAFTNAAHRFRLTQERIENKDPDPGHDNPYFHFDLSDRGAIVNFRGERERRLRPENLSPEQSVLSQLRDPEHYPELTWLADRYAGIRLYREWTFGRNAPSRAPQDAALPNDYLMEGGQNLGLMVNRLKREPRARKHFLGALHQLYEGVEDFDVIVEGGTVQVILQEGEIAMPAVRLSDGTLRYLALLAVLCHPDPPPLVCLEEPELGLHPDVLPGLAELLCDASERCQLIVTTHSEALVDALTDTPESVVTCEKHAGQTRLRRLDRERLSHWLDRYRLGALWTSGELGGNRW